MTTEKEKALCEAIAGIFVLCLGVIFYKVRDMATIGIILIIIGLFGTVYFLYKSSKNGENTAKAAGITTFGCIVCIVIALLAMPQIQEEIQDNSIITPTYTATVEVNIAPDQLHGVDYKLYQDDKLVEEFHLLGWESWSKEFTITWKGKLYESVEFRVESFDSWVIGEGQDSETVTLTDGSYKQIVLYA